MKIEVQEALEFKIGLESDFQKATNIQGREFYSALYSLPQKSPVMWINLNPGGTPEQHQVLSDDQLGKGLHEFWHGDGKTSIATGAFLQKIFQLPVDRLCSVQGTNVAWERSQKGADIDLRAAAKRAAPFLARYLKYSSPSIIIFGGSAAFDLYQEVHDATVVESHEILMGNWGTRQARIFMSVLMDVPSIGKVKAVVVSHPSRGIRAGVLEKCRDIMVNIELPVASTLCSG